MRDQRRAEDRARAEGGESWARFRSEKKKRGEPTDILHKLINARYRDGSAVKGHEIAGMLIAALFAGQHTSSVTTTWTLLFLLDDDRKQKAANPSCTTWLDSVMAELRSLEPRAGAFARGEVAHEQVVRMEKLHAAVKESIRMFPPLIFLMRRVVGKPLEVDGYSVPVGHNVMVSTAVANRLPEVFSEPDEWKPQRWTDFDVRKLPPYSFIGFGAGIHTCMGESFAFSQIKTILAVLLSTYECEMTGPLPPANYDAMVVMPHGPNLVRFRRRSGLGAERCAQTSGTPQKDLDSGVSDPGHASASILATAGKSFEYADTAGEDAEDAELTPFTREEIAQHRRRDDLWIICDGKVYDVTQYLPVHQGGDALLKFGGKDATAGVYGEQHPSTVPTLLRRYLIGRVLEE
jgi:hypothetical protein